MLRAAVRAGADRSAEGGVGLCGSRAVVEGGCFRAGGDGAAGEEPVNVLHVPVPRAQHQTQPAACRCPDACFEH
eukprot:9559299-Alexandrium_andersonii.AAC.1